MSVKLNNSSNNNNNSNLTISNLQPINEYTARTTKTWKDLDT